MHKGSLLFLLHAHLPYVRHPEHEFSIEENWLYEAAVESYIPLLQAFERLINDRVKFKIAVSLSPTLLEMLSDDLLKERLSKYIEKRIELAGKEVLRNKNGPFGPVSEFYLKRLKGIRRIYEGHYKGDLVGAFRALSKTRNIEFITTAATHAYLPNLAPFPDMVKAQIEFGLGTFEKHIRKAPSGLWLPECGYYPGLDAILKKSGVGYFFLEGHGILHGTPRAKYGIYRPVRCPSGVAAFGRDAEAARLVWCAETGYPGDPDYREFHRDIGYNRPSKYLKPYTGGLRVPTGLKYYRVTGKTERKKPYVREKAVEKSRLHALDYIEKFGRRAGEVAESIRRKGGAASPLFVAPFDAELFGHWWFEGPEWLECVLRNADGRLKTVTPSEYLSENPNLQRLSPAFSSWGYGGYSDTWVNEETDSFVAEIHKACGVRGTAPSLMKLSKRAVNQAMRELFLAQSSDWTFLINKGSEYAKRRIKGHLANFYRLTGIWEQDSSAGGKGKRDGGSPSSNLLRKPVCRRAPHKN